MYPCRRMGRTQGLVLPKELVASAAVVTVAASSPLSLCADHGCGVLIQPLMQTNRC